MVRLPLCWTTLSSVLLLTAPLISQHTWRTLPGAQPAGRWSLATAWDAGRGRLVLFGGAGVVVRGDTWEWDGATWTRRDPANAPRPRYLAAMAYDESRRRVVMFGGVATGTTSEGTWEWNGIDWNEVTTPNRPSDRHSHSLTWDPVRRHVVLFGGRERAGTGAALDDTWAYDGLDWTRIRPASSPPARYGHGAAFDEARGRLVIYAGSGGSPHDDVWEFDGSAWTDVTPAIMPPPRNAPLAFDRRRGRTVLYGGAPAWNDTWEWDGTAWRQVPTPVDAGRRANHALVFDATRGEVLAVGGQLPDPYLGTSSLAAFDGTTWHSRTSAPVFRADSGAAYHSRSGKTITFGGQIGLVTASDETHVFDGTRWSRVTTSVGPPARTGHALVSDRQRGAVLLFGGGPPGAALADTWEWDGSSWHIRNPSTSPAARVHAAVCYDDRRARVVVYSGAPPGFSAPFADTWEWDGNDWRRVDTAVSPGARVRAAMAYDPVRGVAVLFGGGSGPGGFFPTDETWEYDGVDWRQARPRHHPLARVDHSMTWDAVRRRILLAGGTSTAGPLDDTWEYDGNDWVDVTGPVRPPFAVLVFDERLGRTLGIADGFETWERRSETPPTIEVFGNGCGGVSGPLELRAAPGAYPVIGRPLSVVTSRVRPAWPVVLMLGVSRTSVHGHPLPLDLTPAGMPRCALLQSNDDVMLALADARGEATVRIGIANDPAILGAEVYLQGFAPDATANTLGWAASAGLAVRVGR